jgi:hypothetical protein
MFYDHLQRLPGHYRQQASTIIIIATIIVYISLLITLSARKLM